MIEEKVRLKVNMVLGGRIVRVGSIVARSEIPRELLKAKYVEGVEEQEEQRTPRSPPPAITDEKQQQPRKPRRR